MKITRKTIKDTEHVSGTTIAKSLNKAYRQASIDKQSFDIFKQQLGMLYEQIATIDTEEKHNPSFTQYPFLTL